MKQSPEFIKVEGALYKRARLDVDDLVYNITMKYLGDRLLVEDLFSEGEGRAALNLRHLVNYELNKVMPEGKDGKLMRSLVEYALQHVTPSHWHHIAMGLKEGVEE